MCWILTGCLKSSSFFFESFHITSQYRILVVYSHYSGRKDCTACEWILYSRYWLQPVTCNFNSRRETANAFNSELADLQFVLQFMCINTSMTMPDWASVHVKSGLSLVGQNVVSKVDQCSMCSWKESKQSASNVSQQPKKKKETSHYQFPRP